MTISMIDDICAPAFRVQLAQDLFMQAHAAATKVFGREAIFTQSDEWHRTVAENAVTAADALIVALSRERKPAAPAARPMRAVA